MANNATLKQQRAEYWGDARKDFRTVLNGTYPTDRQWAIVEILSGNPGKQWWTIGELCDLARCYAVCYITDTTRDRFEDLPKREQYLIMEYAVKDLVKTNTLDHCLGSDDGREIRVYALLKQGA